jgi:hypothetical protein
MLVTYKNGSVVRKNVKLRETSRGGGEEEGGAIADAQARRGGAAPAKPAAKPNDPNAAARAKAIATLATVYENATPDRYPGLFRNGQKISMEEAKRLIQQRYQ